MSVSKSLLLNYRRSLKEKLKKKERKTRSNNCFCIDRLWSLLVARPFFLLLYIFFNISIVVISFKPYCSTYLFVCLSVRVFWVHNHKIDLWHLILYNKICSGTEIEKKIQIQIKKEILRDIHTHIHRYIHTYIPIIIQK